jgi:glycosyltransferase involved in cell wall biosynthesis
MTPPLISCIVPVFNGERYVKEALDSILAQTYRPLEVLVADDGSTDETAAVVTPYGAPVRYLSQPNAGPAAARNLGLCAARGEFVAFLDADDLWHPEKLALQMARFQARPELDLCVAYVQNFWSRELTDVSPRYRDHPRLTKPWPGYLTQTLLARRTVFDTIGQFDSVLRHSSDTDWFLRAAERGAVMELLADTLVYRRLHRANYSRLEASTSREEYLRLVKASLDRRRRLNQERSPDVSRKTALPHAR